MFKYTTDKYGSTEFEVEDVDQFKAQAAEFGLTELNWRTDGERDYYTDQDGEIILEEVA